MDRVKTFVSVKGAALSFSLKSLDNQVNNFLETEEKKTPITIIDVKDDYSGGDIKRTLIYRQEKRIY